jgi:hypothetical protein
VKTVYKYPVIAITEFSLEMPAESKVLSVQMQRSEACLWALVETDSPMVMRHFYVIGTGHEFKPAGDVSFVGTFQVTGALGTLMVFHLFERLQ